MPGTLLSTSSMLAHSVHLTALLGDSCPQPYIMGQRLEDQISKQITWLVMGEGIHHNCHSLSLNLMEVFGVSGLNDWKNMVPLLGIGTFGEEYSLVGKYKNLLLVILSWRWEQVITGLFSPFKYLMNWLLNLLNIENVRQICELSRIAVKGLKHPLDSS